MLDPIQIPILLKAIDFLFDEGRKILDERRERRKTQQTADKTEAPVKKEQQPPQAEVVPSEQDQIQTVKEDLLASRIDSNAWSNHEEEVQHLVRLLETYTRNYHLAKEQYAKWGDALVPPIIVHNLTGAENSVAETLRQLETVLSKVYQKDISSKQ